MEKMSADAQHELRIYVSGRVGPQLRSWLRWEMTVHPKRRYQETRTGRRFQKSRGTLGSVSPLGQRSRLPLGFHRATSSLTAPMIGSPIAVRGRLSHDTPTFAAHAIARWSRPEGLIRYPRPRPFLILSDAGGSNGDGCRAWKTEPR